MERVKEKDFNGNYNLCPYPKTQEIFHTNKVHVLICRGCQFAKHYNQHGGVSCEYGKE